MKKKFSVEIEMPAGAKVGDMKQFIEDALIREIKIRKGQEREMGFIRAASIKVKSIYAACGPGRPKVKVKAPKKRYRRFPDESLYERVPNKPPVFL